MPSTENQEQAGDDLRDPLPDDGPLSQQLFDSLLDQQYQVYSDSNAQSQVYTEQSLFNLSNPFNDMPTGVENFDPFFHQAQSQTEATPSQTIAPTSLFSDPNTTLAATQTIHPSPLPITLNSVTSSPARILPQSALIYQGTSPEIRVAASSSSAHHQPAITSSSPSKCSFQEYSGPDTQGESPEYVLNQTSNSPPRGKGKKVTASSLLNANVPPNQPLSSNIDPELLRNQALGSFLEGAAPRVPFGEEIVASLFPDGVETSPMTSQMEPQYSAIAQASLATQPYSADQSPSMPAMRLKKFAMKLVKDKPVLYNSSFHTAKEAPGHTIPSEEPRFYSLWLPLICRTQNIAHEAIQRITIPQAQCRLLLEASKASIVTRQMNRVFLAEMQRCFRETLSNLTYPSSGLFLRLEECSPKDGVGGTKPVCTVWDILLRLTTSQRSMNAIRRTLEANKDAEIFFMPFNQTFHPAKEFRVFCAPIVPASHTSERTTKITAISQYRWFEPWLWSSENKERMVKIAYSVMAEAGRIHNLILGYIKDAEDKRKEMDELLLKQGFTFDILWNEENGRGELVELNPFGARSGAGSCLFHWIADEKILYGEEEGEFRITAMDVVEKVVGAERIGGAASVADVPT